jgi:GTP pyrophosphokinase
VVSSKHLQGIGDHNINLANCCAPQIGDKIIGELLSSKSIQIHYKSCPEILLRATQKNQHKKLIELNWGEHSNKEKINIQIDAFDRQGLLQDVTTLLNQAQVNVLKANTETDSIDQSVSMELTIEVNSDIQYDPLLKQIRQIPNIFQATYSDNTT